MKDEIRSKLERLFNEHVNGGGDPKTFERAVECLVERERRLQEIIEQGDT